MTITLHEAVTLSVQLHMVPRRLSRQDIASALGITPSAVTARFRGRTKWSLDDVDALCQLLGLTPAELVTPPLHALIGSQVREAAEHVQRIIGGTATHESQPTAAAYELAA